MKSSIRSVALATAALACASLTCVASARADDLRWQGTLFVTAVTSACAPAGSGAAAQVGDQWTFVFRAADDGQALSIIGQRRAMAFAPQGGAFKKAGQYAGTFIGANAIGRQSSAAYSNFKFTPSKFGASDRSILISGVISDFDGYLGCETTFEAAGVRRPGF